MWGKSMRGDGVFDMRRFCISPNCPQLMSKSERNESGVLYASRREAPENFDAFRLVLQPQSFSAVIVSRHKKPASRFSTY
jgi:hypothetical protein